ncbi:MAG: hypothetical protein HY830_13985 [Actinobacteria bacterium]|nr:hypothetical protein [Actinomycetota bacterium]
MSVVERIRREPVLVVALVQALLVAGVAFGLDLTDAQAAAVLGVTGAGLALVARSRVTPVRGTSGAHESN